MEATMNANLNKRRLLASVIFAGAAGFLASCSQMSAMNPMAAGQQVTLSGSSEVPPVTTTASGTGTVDIKPDRTVTANITVTGMTPTAVHIHEAAPGTNGPVIVPFTKVGDDRFVAPEGARLTESQYNAFKEGKLYVNVHSAKNPGGEIRAQLKGG